MLRIGIGIGIGNKPIRASGNPELVANGNFATLDSTGWESINGTWDFSTGVAIAPAQTAYQANFMQWIPVTPSTLYELTVGINTGAVRIYGYTAIWGTNIGQIISYTAVGSTTFTTQATATYIKVMPLNSSGTAETRFDDISIKQAA